MELASKKVMIIGITGGIGSGKSTIARGLRELGYMVYDTDHAAKRLIMEDESVHRQIEDLFGRDVFKDGVYQTQLVAQRVFNDRRLLDKLNGIVHPAVKSDIQEWQKKQEREGVELLFIECAILYEAKLDTVCDKVVLITAPEAIRLERTMLRDGANADQVRARMRSQQAGESVTSADLVVNNDGKTEIMTICLQIRDFFCNFAG